MASDDSSVKEQKHTKINWRLYRRQGEFQLALTSGRMLEGESGAIAREVTIGG